MQIRFHVTGMMCNGCSGTVQEALLELAGVSEVAVDLEASQVLLTSERELTAAQVQAALPEPYTVSA